MHQILALKRLKCVRRLHDIKLRLRGSLHNVAVDHLDEDHCAVVRHNVKGLGLDIGVGVCAPAQQVLVRLRIRSSLGLLRNRLDGLGAIDRLLGAHHSGETARIDPVSNHSTEGSNGTYVDLSQFMMKIG